MHSNGHPLRIHCKNYLINETTHMKVNLVVVRTPLQHIVIPHALLYQQVGILHGNTLTTPGKAPTS